MTKFYFKNTTNMLVLLGIVWQTLECVQDFFIVGYNGYSLQNAKLMLNHFSMGLILGCFMRYTYLKSKKSKNKYIQDLHSSEERLGVIFDNSPLGIVHFNQTGNITNANGKFFEIFESPREKVIGFNMLTQLNDDKMKFALESALNGKVTCYEGTYTSVISGKTLPLKTFFNCINSESGEFLGGVGMFEDISEKKRIDKELARLDRLDLVGQMSASIGHEIRNPMTAVRGFLQLLGNQEIDSIKKEYYEVMINELDRANTIITEFVSLAKDKIVKLESKSINDIIDLIYPLILVDALKQDKNIRLNKGIIPNIPLDESEIRQMIFNLVRNGLEAMPRGKDLIIRTYTEDDAVVLEVQDEGSGISAEVIDRIGTPFLTTKETGTGLGLPVCYSIVERHQAKIDFKTDSSGTTFFVFFKMPNTVVQTKLAS